MLTTFCLVCDKQHDGTTHCSVMICRACAMFYKRCQSLKTFEPCKSGTNNCKLNEPRKIPCQFCRYKKCRQVGLKIQDSARGLKTDSKTLGTTNEVEPNGNSLSFDRKLLVPKKMPTLKRYCYHYALTANTRKDYELMLLRQNGDELMNLPGNKQMGYMSESRSNIWWKYDALDLSILNGAFPAFTRINNHEKDAIFHMIKFLIVDLYTSFRTWRVFNDVNTKRLICSEVLFIDFDDMNSYVDNGKMDPMDVKTVADFFSTSWRQLLNDTLRLLNRIKLTDVEYLATCSLVIWDEGNYIHLPHLTRMSEVHRNMIYKDLDFYYKNILKVDNYVDRIMNIKDLLKTLRVNLGLVVGCTHFLRAFNYYEGKEEMLIASEKVIRLIEEQNNII